MPRYTDDSRERVRDAVDFAELVGARTELRQAGPRRLSGLCPFHEERTPSFGIDPVEKLYHCFGCGEGGDVFKFVMATEGVDFTAALELLADRFGVQLEPVAEDPREAARRGRRDRLLGLLERTAAWYVRVLWESDEAAGGREYLAGRGLSEAALREYRVGYAPSAWDRVLFASRRAGYTEEELWTAGLAQRSREGRVYDRFRRRIMFPLTDVRGRVLGFGARALGADQQPKYVNSSDGEVFHKAEIVYGADLARAGAARAGRVVLVEGYTDVIALHQAGVPEVVATMGTALTDRQVDAVRRLAPTVLLCQDSDAAGQEAIERGAAALSRARGLDVRVVRLPAGMDPADVAQRSGGDEMRALLERAIPFARFEVERALEAAASGRLDDREHALAGAARAIRGLGASVLRDELIQLVAGRLDLSISLVESAIAQARAAPGGPNGRLHEGARGAGRAAGGSGASPPDGPGPHHGGTPAGAHTALDRREAAERAFLALCVAAPQEGERRLAAMDLDTTFSAAATRRAAEYLRGRLATPAAALPPDDEPLARLVAELVIRAGELEASPAALELEALQLELARLDRQITHARVSGEPAGIASLAAERQRVRAAIRERMH